MVKAVPRRLVRTLLGVTLLAGVLVHPSVPPAAAQAPASSGPTEHAYRVDDVDPQLRSLPGGRLVARSVRVDPFTTIGASFTSSAGGEARVRAHLPSGWTPWFALHHGHEGGASTDPVWVGDAADGYEVRLPADAVGVVVHLVRPTGEAVELTRTPDAATEAANAAPPVQRRSAWGAAPYRGTIRYNDRVTRGVVHHTVNTNGYSADQVPGMLRSIQAYHQGSARNWPDIAYNFIVDRFGTIWEARARSYDRLTRVSASSGTTEDTVTVAFLGDGSSQAAPSASIRAMGRLLGWKLRKHGLRPTRANVVAHREIGQTSCPGAALLAQVPTIERIAIEGNPPSGPFYDVPWTDSDARAVDWAADEEIIPGFEDLTFRPRRPASRADTVVWVWRLAGRPSGASHPFTDVPEGAPYEEALQWASGAGIVRGVTATRFGPGQDSTRQEFVDLLWRWVGSPEVAVDHRFTDVGARESLDWASASDLVTGAGFRPSAVVLRVTAAAFLHHLRPFEDVGRGHVARRAVDWARAHVIAGGFPDHTFRPADAVTRGQAAGWVWRFLDRPPGGPSGAAPSGHDLDRATAVTWLWEAAGSPTVTLPSGYTDVAGAPHEMAAAWAQDFGLFPDVVAPTFAASTVVTRAQFVRALYRLAGLPNAWDGPPPGTVRF